MLIQPFKSDQHLISPLAIFPESHFKVTRIKGMSPTEKVLDF